MTTIVLKPDYQAEEEAQLRSLTKKMKLSSICQGNDEEVITVQPKLPLESKLKYLYPSLSQQTITQLVKSQSSAEETMQLMRNYYKQTKQKMQKPFQYISKKRNFNELRYGTKKSPIEEMADLMLEQKTEEDLRKFLYESLLPQEEKIINKLKFDRITNELSTIKKKNENLRTTLKAVKNCLSKEEKKNETLRAQLIKNQNEIEGLNNAIMREGHFIDWLNSIDLNE